MSHAAIENFLSATVVFLLALNAFQAATIFCVTISPELKDEARKLLKRVTRIGT